MIRRRPFALALGGTSLTSGIFAPWGEQLADTLRQQPEAVGPIRVANFGRGSMGSAWGRSMARRIAAWRPTHALLEGFAINDSIFQSTPTSVVPNIFSDAPTDSTGNHFIASATSSQIVNELFPWMAFDGNDFSGWQPDTTAPPTWLQIRLATPQAIRRYSLRVSGTLTAWRIEGTNNGIDFTLIDERTGVAAWGSGTTRSYDVNPDSVERYLAYRFTPTNTWVSGTEVKSWALFTVDSSGNFATSAERTANLTAIRNTLKAGNPGLVICWQTMSSIASSLAAGRPNLAAMYTAEMAFADANGDDKIDHYAAWPKPLSTSDTYNSDGLHPLPAAFNQYTMPAIITWARAKMAAHWGV